MSVPTLSGAVGGVHYAGSIVKYYLFDFDDMVIGSGVSLEEAKREGDYVEVEYYDDLYGGERYYYEYNRPGIIEQYHISNDTFGIFVKEFSSYEELPGNYYIHEVAKYDKWRSRKEFYLEEYFGPEGERVDKPNKGYCKYTSNSYTDSFSDAVEVKTYYNTEGRLLHAYLYKSGCRTDEYRYISPQLMYEEVPAGYWDKEALGFIRYDRCDRFGNYESTYYAVIHRTKFTTLPSYEGYELEISNREETEGRYFARTDYDKYGNEIIYAYFGPNGEPVSDPVTNVHYWIGIRDNTESGSIIREIWFDVNGRVLLTSPY
jgi:hypothetical protein